MTYKSSIFVVLNDIAAQMKKPPEGGFWCFLVARGGIDQR